MLFENNFIPFKIVKEKLYEVNIKEEIYTNEQAIVKAQDVALEKLRKNNKNIVEIKNVKILNKKNNGSVINLNLFVAVIEDITKIVEVKEEMQEIVEN